MIVAATKYSLAPERISAGTRGSYGIEKLEFAFSSDWDGLVISVVFYPSRGKPVKIPYLGGEIDIPPEVMAYDGAAQYVLAGALIDEEGHVERQIISLRGYIDVENTLPARGGNSGKITPDVYDKFLEEASKEIVEKVDEALAEAKASGEFKGDPGEMLESITQKTATDALGNVSHTIEVTTNTGRKESFTVSDGKKGERGVSIEQITVTDEPRENGGFRHNIAIRTDDGKTEEFHVEDGDDYILTQKDKDDIASSCMLGLAYTADWNTVTLAELDEAYSAGKNIQLKNAYGDVAHLRQANPGQYYEFYALINRTTASTNENSAEQLYFRIYYISSTQKIITTLKAPSLFGTDYVSTAAQTLAEEKKEQARNNIGAMPADTKIPRKTSELTNDSGFITSKDLPEIPESAVQSVNGKTGEVQLSASDVGALPDDTKIPAKTSDLTNDSGFITKAATDLANYYAKSQTYSREEIDQKMSLIPKFEIAVVSSLPASNISGTTVYLVKSGAGGDLYTEYIYVHGAWEILGSQRVDLTGYATEEWVNLQLADYLTADKLTAAIITGALGYVPAKQDEIPSVPVQSVNGKTGDVELSASDVGAATSGQVEQLIEEIGKLPRGAYYIVGNSTSAGVWTGVCEAITEYYDGLTVLYKINVAGVSGGTTLNINSLGAVPVRRNASTAVTTIYPVGSVVMLTYSGGAWLTADYDANTKNTAGSANKANTKLYLVGAASQTSSGTTTNTNSGAYIGEDNCLYSNGKKVALEEDIPDVGGVVKSVNGFTPDETGNVTIEIGGGTVSGNVLIGQTPITLNKSANVRLIGSGEYTYTVKGKTIADISTAIAKGNITETSVELTNHGSYYEMQVVGEPANWFKAYVTIDVKGLTVGTKYLVAVIKTENASLDSGIGSFYAIIKNTSGTQLETLDPGTAGLHTVEFTADTTDITITWYITSNYYWGNNCRTVRINDLYINKAEDGTDKTEIIDLSGDFTDTYSFGQLSAGVTITTDPSCEVYDVVGSDSPGGAAAPLAGKTVVCFGDSLFGMYTGDTSAPAYAAKYTGATVYNVGFGGCRMSQHPYPEYDKFCMYALADAIASGDWSAQDEVASQGSANFPAQLEILKNIDFSAVDMVVVHYGTNDFTAGSSGVTIDNPDNPKATNTLCGALRYSIEKLLSAYPQIKIFVSLPAFRFWESEDGTITTSDDKINGKGNTLIDFGRALAETAKEYKMPYIDCYHGLGINKENRATYFNPNDGTHHNEAGRKRFGEYIGAKLAAGGDTILCETSGGSGGASIDVTAQVGQTIIVKEIDENGKPTAWESADYQPRTHWSEVVKADIVPQITFTPAYNETFGIPMFPISPIELIVGNEYTVIFDDVEYHCTAIAGNFRGISFIAIGNEIFAGGNDTGQPFAVAVLVDMNMYIVECMDLNEHTIKVTGDNTVVHKIPDAYAPKSDFMIDVGLSPTTGGLVLYTDFQSILDAIAANKNVYAKVLYSGGLINGDVKWNRYLYYRLIEAKWRDDGCGKIQLAMPLTYHDNNEVPNRFGDTIVIEYYGVDVKFEYPNAPTD